MADSVPAWLKALDLGQYESSMMANGFDNIRFLVSRHISRIIYLNFVDNRFPYVPVSSSSHDEDGSKNVTYFHTT